MDKTTFDTGEGSSECERKSEGQLTKTDKSGQDFRNYHGVVAAKGKGKWAAVEPSDSGDDDEIGNENANVDVNENVGGNGPQYLEGDAWVNLEPSDDYHPDSFINETFAAIRNPDPFDPSNGEASNSGWMANLVRREKKKEEDCVEFFNACVAANYTDEQWFRVDEAKNNILHIAVYSQNARTIQWLLENMDPDKRLSEGHNNIGHTPLQSMEFVINGIRKLMDGNGAGPNAYPPFTSFPPEFVSCLAVLKGRDWISPARLLCLKYGCTCGSCFDGFISPRMQFYLATSAEMIVQSFDDIWIADNDKMWYNVHSDLTKHLSSRVMELFRTDKYMRLGFVGAFRLVEACVKAKKAPSTYNIETACTTSFEWPPVTQYFFQNGGTVEGILRVLFEEARDMDDKPGSGGFFDLFASDINPLPKCRNDLEFAFVARICGVPELGVRKFE